MKNLLIIGLLFISYASISQTKVKGYINKSGDYISPHYRSSPNSTKYDNYSTKGNVNPYTGKLGTKNVYDNYYNTTNEVYYTPNVSMQNLTIYDSYYYQQLSMYEARKRRNTLWFIIFLLTTTAGISLFYKG